MAWNLLHPTVQRQCGCGERGALLSDEEMGFAGGLDPGLLDRGDGGSSSSTLGAEIAMSLV